MKNNVFTLTITIFLLSSCLGDEKEETVTKPLWVTSGWGANSHRSYESINWETSKIHSSSKNFRGITSWKTFGEFIAVGNEGLIYKSSDNGTTWES